MSTSTYDIAVIGGGIHGAAIAWDATLRGFSVVLLEKGDFGAGASAGNYRIIHGGLRYLQHFDLPRLFESANEQKIFRKIVPDALVPLPFLIPCYGFGMRGKEILEIGVSLYDVLTFSRNSGVKRSLKLPWHQSLNAKEVLDKFPYLESKNLRGGIIYFDAQMLDPDRLTLSFILSSKTLGCIVKNYTEVTGTEINNSEIQSLKIRNIITNSESQIKARLVINSTGAWREQVTAKLLNITSEPKYLYSKGLQITLPEITNGVGVALESKFKDSEAFVAKGNRSYFLQPWRGYTIAGTADIIHSTEPDTYSLKEEEVTSFVDELRQLYPDPLLKRENVKSVFGGLRPVTPAVVEKFRQGKLSNYGSIEVAHRDTVVDHRSEKGELRVKNLISVEGIKYTTTRKLAERVVDLSEIVLQEKRNPCKTTSQALQYAPANFPPSVDELKRIVNEEFVHSFDDIVERRLGLGALPRESQELQKLELTYKDIKAG
jgi:glycerol-3-phosphate dehydrogenase